MVTNRRSNSARSTTQSATDMSPGRARTASRRSPRFAIRRVYDVDQNEDGYRVLVDRLWPRGISKPKAALDDWAKDLAPGTELRQWYQHDPAKFELFARRYRQELKRTPAQEAVRRLRSVARRKRVTLVTATRDLDHSGARVLRDVLTGKSRSRTRKEDRR
jgi:uncharacterized protein YeaO (DUF488 family)